MSDPCSILPSIQWPIAKDSLASQCTPFEIVDDQGDMHRTMIELHKKQGKLVRTSPNEIGVPDLSAVKKIYGASIKFAKSPWYSVCGKDIANLIFLPNVMKTSTAHSDGL